jgi:hypothetical protein
VLSTAMALASDTMEKLYSKAKDNNLIIGKAYTNKANDVFVNILSRQKQVKPSR